MFRRGMATFVVPTLLLLAVAGLASARIATKSHKVNVSGYIDTVTSNGATGAPGSTETDAGIFSGTISGESTKGAFYQNSTWGGRA
jgi:hypothetical protein